MKYIIGIDAGFVATGLVIYRAGIEKPIGVGIVKPRIDAYRKQNLRVADSDFERARQLTIGIQEFYGTFVMPDDQVMVGVELPHAGAQDGRANRTMGIATGIIGAFFQLFDNPIERVTPDEVKIALTKRSQASKKQCMDAVAKAYGLKVEKKGNGVYYNICGGEYPGGNFEHIADAIGVVWHMEKHSDMYKVFIQ